MSENAKKYGIIGIGIALIIGLTIITCRPKKSSTNQNGSSISETKKENKKSSNNSEKNTDSDSIDTDKLETISKIANSDPDKWQDEYDELSSAEKEYYMEHYMSQSIDDSNSGADETLSNWITEETVQQAYSSNDSYDFEQYITNLEYDNGIYVEDTDNPGSFEDNWGSLDEEYVMKCWEYDPSLKDVYYFTAYPPLGDNVTVNGNKIESGVIGTETAFVEIKDGTYKLKYLTWAPLRENGENTIVMLTDGSKTPAEWATFQQKLEIAYSNQSRTTV